MTSSKKSLTNQKVDYVVAGIDLGVLASIFTLFMNELLTQFLEEIGRFFLFPLAATLSLLRAVLAWRQVHLDQGQKGTVAKALVETVAALAITTAVVGGFVAASIFATVAPIIFTAALGGKALFHAAATVNYGIKSWLADKDDANKKEYWKTMKTHAVTTLALGLASAAVALVLIAAKPILGILGVAGGLIGIVLCANKAFKLHTKAAAQSNNNLEEVKSSTAGIRQKMKIAPTPDNSLSDAVTKSRSNNYGAMGKYQRPIRKFSIERKDDDLGNTLEQTNRFSRP